jgi:hypothetical protein
MENSMTVDQKTLDAIATWGRDFCKRDPEQATALRSSTDTARLDESAAKSHPRTRSKALPKTMKVQTRTARFVEMINEMAKANAESDRVAIERAVQRMHKGATPAADVHAKKSNQASTADGNGAIFDFFKAHRR